MIMCGDGDDLCHLGAAIFNPQPAAVSVGFRRRAPFDTPPTDGGYSTPPLPDARLREHDERRRPVHW